MISQRNARMWILSHPILKDLDFNLKLQDESMYSRPSHVLRFFAHEIRTDYWPKVHYDGAYAPQLDVFLWQALSNPHEHPMTDEIVHSIRMVLSNSLIKHHIKDDCPNTYLWLLTEEGNIHSTISAMLTIKNKGVLCKTLVNQIMEPYRIRYNGILYMCEANPVEGVRQLKEFLKEVPSKTFQEMFPNFWVDIESKKIHSLLFQALGLKTLLRMSNKESKCYIPSSLLNLSDIQTQELLLQNVDIIDYRNRKALYQAIANKKVKTEDNYRFLLKFYSNYNALIPEELNISIKTVLGISEMTGQNAETLLIEMMCKNQDYEEVDLII